jgi:hypothetical protein
MQPDSKNWAAGVNLGYNSMDSRIKAKDEPEWLISKTMNKQSRRPEKMLIKSTHDTIIQVSKKWT